MLTPAERREIQRLTLALRDGERAAVEPLYARLWPLVRAFVRRRLPLDPSEAEDVAQQALLKLFARVAEFDPRRDALAFALGIALWELRTFRRRRERRRELPLDIPAVAERAAQEPTPEERALAADLETALVEVLGELAPDDVEALRAWAEDRRPAGAAYRKRLQRALERLRRVWRSSHVG